LAHRRRNKRYRRGRLTIVTRILSFAVICGAIVAALILFFKVESVEITGNERYSDEQIFAVTEIEYGENLFLLNKYAIADEITGRLPYIQSVRFKRSLPNGIVIEVKEGVATAAVEQGDDAWLIAQDGKLLEKIAVGESGDYLRIVGCELLLPTEGTYLAMGEDSRLSQERLLELLDALADKNMLRFTEEINCSDEDKLILSYGGRFDVELLYDADFPKKLLALQLVVDTLEANETGTVILTAPDRSSFKPGRK